MASTMLSSRSRPKAVAQSRRGLRSPVWAHSPTSKTPRATFWVCGRPLPRVPRSPRSVPPLLPWAGGSNERLHALIRRGISSGDRDSRCLRGRLLRDSTPDQGGDVLADASQLLSLRCWRSADGPGSHQAVSPTRLGVGRRDRLGYTIWGRSAAPSTASRLIADGGSDNLSLVSGYGGHRTVLITWLPTQALTTWVREHSRVPSGVPPDIQTRVS